MEGFDLTASYRDAAELAGCSPNTVARYVACREAGTLVPGRAARRPRVIDEFLPKLEKLIERSQGKIRADVAHDKIVAMGFAGSERTTRRAVAEIKKAWRSGRRRVHRPCIPEPGLWAQYDFGDGPRIGGVSTILFCFWLAWCRFQGGVTVAGQDRAERVRRDRHRAAHGGWGADISADRQREDLTDNEKTVTVEHVAGVAVRNPAAVALGAAVRLTVATCLPADPDQQGRVGGDGAGRRRPTWCPRRRTCLTPTAASPSWRPPARCSPSRSTPGARRVTRRAPARCSPRSGPGCTGRPRRRSPQRFGVTRTVGENTPMVTFEHGQYSRQMTVLCALYSFSYVEYWPCSKVTIGVFSPTVRVTPNVAVNGAAGDRCSRARSSASISAGARRVTRRTEQGVDLLGEHRAGGLQLGEAAVGIKQVRLRGHQVGLRRPAPPPPTTLVGRGPPADVATVSP